MQPIFKHWAGRALLLPLLFIFLLMLVGMTIYETLKHLIHPDITLWQSHVVTVIFSALCATIASFFILRRQMALNNALSEKNIESQRLQKELEKTIEELTTAISTVKTLKGLLPICAACKKIRDDNGYWNQIETYLRQHSDVDFSHGICPDCEKKIYPDLYDRIHDVR